MFCLCKDSTDGSDFVGMVEGCGGMMIFSSGKVFYL